MSIKHSVGKNSVNKKDDVLFVQKAINKIFSETTSSDMKSRYPAYLVDQAYGALLSVAPFSPLEENGNSNDKATIASLSWIQNNILKIKPDGSVSATKSSKTLRFLEECTVFKKDKFNQLLNELTLLPSNRGVNNTVKDEDYLRICDDLGINLSDINSVKAVSMVESGKGEGFIKDGRPLIRFEAHIFSRGCGSRSSFHGTKGFYDNVFSYISVSQQDNSLVDDSEGGHVEEYERLRAAMCLDRMSALKATAWGMFQVQGFNWNTSQQVENIVKLVFTSESNQLEIFRQYMKHKHTVEYLKSKNWVSFALKYNGTGQEDVYGKRIKEAYENLEVERKNREMKKTVKGVYTLEPF